MTGEPDTEWGHSRKQKSEGNGRGTTITLNYVLVLGISTVLVTGLIIAGGTFVEEQRENVIQGELNVIGTHLAGNLEQVDRYVKASDGEPNAHINQSFQQDVTGEGYNIELEPNEGDTEPPEIILSAQRADVTVTVNATVSTDVEHSSAQGGTISIYYDDGLVIGNA